MQNQVPGTGNMNVSQPPPPVSSNTAYPSSINAPGPNTGNSTKRSYDDSQKDNAEGPKPSSSSRSAASSSTPQKKAEKTEEKETKKAAPIMVFKLFSLPWLT